MRGSLLFKECISYPNEHFTMKTRNRPTNGNSVLLLVLSSAETLLWNSRGLVCCQKCSYRACQWPKYATATLLIKDLKHLSLYFRNVNSDKLSGVIKLLFTILWVISSKQPADVCMKLDSYVRQCYVRQQIPQVKTKVILLPAPL